jgi:hypothetical protein
MHWVLLQQRATTARVSIRSSQAINQKQPDYQPGAARLSIRRSQAINQEQPGNQIRRSQAINQQPPGYQSAAARLSISSRQAINQQPPGYQSGAFWRGRGKDVDGKAEIVTCRIYEYYGAFCWARCHPSWGITDRIEFLKPCNPL